MNVGRIIWILIAVAIGAFVLNRYIDNKAKDKLQEAETQRKFQDTKMAVSQMSARYNAITDWDMRLSKGKSYRSTAILTIELEQLWQGGRPILFLGSIKDISSATGGSYNLILAREVGNPWLDTPLQLSLNAPRTIIDSYVANHPALFTEYSFGNRAAVVAKITGIRTSKVANEDGNQVEVKTGFGDLLEIQYTDYVDITNDPLSD